MWPRVLSIPLLLAGVSCDSGVQPADSGETWSPHPLCSRLESLPSCAPRGFAQCAPEAQADATTFIGARSILAAAPYDHPGCAGRFLVDVDTEDFVASRQQPRDWELPMWIAALWDYEQIGTPERCHDVVIDVAVMRELTSGDWEPWDEFRVIGSWTESRGACETVHCGGGRYPDGSLANTKAAPQTWVDINDTRRVRLALSLHDSACRQYDVHLSTAETL